MYNSSSAGYYNNFPDENLKGLGSSLMENIIHEYEEHNNFYSYEGDSGVKKLNQLLSDMGYLGHNYMYGSPLESFLSDNSGAIHALLEWIGKQNIDEWRQSLENSLPIEEENDI